MENTTKDTPTTPHKYLENGGAMTVISDRKKKRILRRAQRHMPNVHYERVTGFRWEVYTRDSKRRSPWVHAETVNGKNSQEMYKYIRAKYPHYFIYNDCYKSVIIIQ